MTDLNLSGESYAHSLISAGHVDKSASWSFSAEDGNALLGKGGDDWAAFGRAHLGLHRDAADKTKARYGYPFAKGGTLYRSALIAIRQRAAQQNDNAIFAAAGKLLSAVDADKEAPEGKVKGFNAEVKDAGDRTLGFVISTASVDRTGDTVAVNGWQLDRYKQNPVVLWAHLSTQLPVGMAQNVRTEGGALKADVKFTPEGMHPFNDTVYGMYKGGFLSATSVGFAPLKYEPSNDPARKMGIDFLEQELLEFSLVPIPANPDALIEARSAGFDLSAFYAPDEEMIVAEARRIAKRKDLFANAFVRDLADDAGIEILTAAWKSRVIATERIEQRNRQRTMRKRDMELIRLRGL